MLGLRLARPERPTHEDWRRVAVPPRDSALLGISFRPRQVEAFGLDGPATLDSLLEYPFELLRLGSYWDRIETTAGEFDTRELDWQLAAAERAGKRVILSIGPIKNFGYPEYYVPKHQLERKLGGRTVYADGSAAKPPGSLFAAISERGRRWMVAEGQAEPWETTTVPPNPPGKSMFSCGPHHLIENYSAAISWSSRETLLYAYLFWGAEYWILRA